MGRYTRCPRCGNIEVGEYIYICTECNKMYCDTCGDYELAHIVCPECNSKYNATRGQIEEKSSESEDEDDLANDEYSECPKCGNIEDGEKVMECQNCDLEFCGNCSDYELAHEVCPNCGSDWKVTRGYIVNEEEDD